MYNTAGLVFAMFLTLLMIFIMRTDFRVEALEKQMEEIKVEMNFNKTENEILPDKEDDKI